MSNPIVKRYCVLLEGTLASPLLAGSGKDIESDYDVILDADGNPYLPGSSLAGACLHYLMDQYPNEQLMIKDLFGSRDGFRSRLYCYHTELCAEVGKGLIRRDGVKLDEHKSSVDQAKYDLQLVDTGTSFRMRLEWIIREDHLHQEDKEEALLCALIDGIVDGSLTFGAKSRRGYGQLKLDNVHIRTFDHATNSTEPSLSWLDWDWNEYDRCITWEQGQSTLNGVSIRNRQLLKVSSQRHVLRVPLAVQDTILIRQYNYDLENDRENYEQLTSGKDSLPVIPGTSWTGAIRRHLSKLIEQFVEDAGHAASLVTQLLGSWTDGKGDHRQKLTASLLSVEESIITESHSFLTTRTAIDRFTGGVKSGALFTARPQVHGDTELVIRWMEPRSGNEPSQQVICGLLMWVVRDLQEGLLPIGGETAIGRGIMKGTDEPKLDGQSIDAQSEKEWSKAARKWCLRSMDEEEEA